MIRKSGHQFSERIMLKQYSTIATVSGLLRTAMLSAPVVLFAMDCALAQATTKPDTEGDRYSLSQSAEGFVRLDNRTGAVSNCTSKGSGWACYSAPDERAALDGEIGRLQAENARLKAELAKRDSALAALAAKGNDKAGEKTNEPLPKSDSEKSAEKITKAPSVEDKGKKVELQLPDDRDLDRVMAFLERAWRRLIEMASRVQKDVSGKI